jgi:RNA polymerase sigma factor (sigma-70 family)
MTTGKAHPDLPLVEAILRGEEDAMREVYTRYAREVWVFLRHHLGDPDLCAEIRDDVFTEAWRSASKFRGEGSLKSWIFGIARHRALDVMGRGRAWVPLEDAAEAAPAGDPERQALRREAVEEFNRALRALDEDHRSVLLMAFVGGLSYAEIGRALGCPEGTIKTRVFYARRKLRELMPEQGHG